MSGNVALAVALLAACFTWWVHRRDAGLQDHVDDCEARCASLQLEVERLDRERADLRRRNELVVAALLSLLPKDARIELLTQIDERTPG